MATAGATQWHHPGLWDPVLWEGKPALSAGLQDSGPATVVWVVASWGPRGTGWRESWWGEESGDRGQRLPESIPQLCLSKGLQRPGAFCTNSRENLPTPHPAVLAPHWAVVDGQDQFHSPSHALATCVCCTTNPPVSPEFSEDFVIL